MHTENYMHTEHRHTKGMGCLKQHNTCWKQHMERDIYDHVTRKRDNHFLTTEGLTGSLNSLGNEFQSGAGPE